MLEHIFNYAESAIYFNDAQKECHVFVDEGWHDMSRGYDMPIGQPLILISVWLKEIPFPRCNDKIQVNDITYQVISIYAQDAEIAVLHVEKQ